MKKSLLFASAIAMSMGAMAQEVVWDFNTHGIFANFQDPDAMEYRDGNYDFVDKYGTSVNTDGEAFCTKDEAGTWHGKNNRLISLYDGMTYSYTPDETCENGTLADAAAFDAEILNHPFFSWEQDTEENPSLGPSRTLWMKGWGSLDAWTDANYNAVDESNWVATKHGFSMQRNGNSASRQQSFVQFPEVQLPCEITYYIGHAGGKYATALRATIQPVVGGEAGDKITAVDLDNETEGIVAKRMYKKTFKVNGTGKAAFRIGCDKMELHLYHVVFNSNYDGKDADLTLGASGISEIVTENVDSNAPVYNIMGQPVNDSYKGFVIKNGKKFLQR